MKSQRAGPTRVRWYYFVGGIRQQADQALVRALENNPFVPQFLLGARLPKSAPEYVGIGDENEAIDYVATFRSDTGAGRHICTRAGGAHDRSFTHCETGGADTNQFEPSSIAR